MALEKAYRQLGMHFINPTSMAPGGKAALRSSMISSIGRESGATSASTSSKPKNFKEVSSKNGRPKKNVGKPHGVDIGGK